MLKTCQLVNILGGTVVYEAIKTVMLGRVFFSLFSLEKIGLSYLIFLMRVFGGTFYLSLVPLIQI